MKKLISQKGLLLLLKNFTRKYNRKNIICPENLIHATRDSLGEEIIIVI